jgi:uncharacterized protein YsxB (DUF464 family)
MTIVFISKDEENKIKKITIKNHSGFGYKGSDIVCASISSIVNGTINFLTENYSDFFLIKCSKKITEISITIKKYNEDAEKYLDFMIYQLENISKNYPNNLIIKKTKNTEL